MIDLKTIHMKNEKTNVDFGITVDELMNNNQYHGRFFYDKWGFAWKVMDGVLHYSDEGYHPKCKREWNEANMAGIDMPYKKFFTPLQFKKIKPNYL